MTDLSGFTADHARLIRKLQSIAELSETDKQALGALPLAIKSIREDQDIVHDHDRPARSCLVLDGFVHRYKMLPDGGRQIISFHIPGDIPDLQSLHLHTMDHSVGTLVPTRVAFIAHSALSDLARQHPGIAAALWRDTLIDAAVFREWIVNIGRRDALERIAHLFCELHSRLQAVDLAGDDGFVLPLTQTEIADATGITPVHVNRTLQDLRGRELIVSEGRFLRIPDCVALRKVAGFDPTYLHMKAHVACGSAESL